MLENIVAIIIKIKIKIVEIIMIITGILVILVTMITIRVMITKLITAIKSALQPIKTLEYDHYASSITVILLPQHYHVP